MKTAPTLLFSAFCAIFGLFVLSDHTYAQENNTPKSLIKIIKPVYFGLPIDCRPDYDCWVMNYVDFGPEDGEQTDPACLARTYDGHKGTDFAVLDGETMQRGIDVLAAAAGTVSRLRNSEKDAWHSKEEIEEIKQSQKECGNGIFIDHGNNVSTVYCHLKLNSITVERGQEVKKGQKIAEVGLSGKTEFPHVHFGIIKDGKVLDPFTGSDNNGECGADKKPLWADDVVLEYQPLVIQTAGFLDKEPDFDAMERRFEARDEISISDGVMTFWVTLLGTREGDKITMEIKDPNDTVFVTREIAQDKTRARQYYYVGKRLYKDKNLEGAYTGSVKVIREDKSWYKTSAVLLKP